MQHLQSLAKRSQRMIKTKTNKSTQKDFKPGEPDKTKEGPKDKSDRHSKTVQPSDVQAAAAKGKGSGKGNKKDDKSPRGKKVKEGDRVTKRNYLVCTLHSIVVIDQAAVCIFMTPAICTRAQSPGV